jgi:AcrR family transcriptional regulator
MPSAGALTARGSATRQRLLDASEQVFARLGYHEASIARITEAAGVGQGTFYLYFASKLAIFEELVEDLNRRVRRAMSEGMSATTGRLDAERAGFRAFFEFTAAHPALYRVVREAELVSPRALRLHYTRIVDGYIEGLSAARDRGEIGDIDPTVVAWALMGIGEMIGMRWVLWGDEGASVPDEVFDDMMLFIRRGLAAPGAPRTEGHGTT